MVELEYMLILKINAFGIVGSNPTGGTDLV